MSDTEKMVLNINTDTFNSFKSDFNNILTAVLQNMQNKELTECDMAMNLNIKFTEDGKRPGHFIMPELRHEIKATFKQTTKKTGSLAPAHTELVYDEDSEQYVLQRMEDGQQDIFAASERPKQDADVINVTPALPEPEPKALPEKISDVDTTSPCKTCVNYKDGQPCGVECDAEYSGYEEKPEDTVVTVGPGSDEPVKPNDWKKGGVTDEDYLTAMTNKPACPKCMYSRQNGQPKKTGPCKDCKGHSNFKGQCSMCFNRNYKPMCEDCDTCDKQHSKWRQA